MIKLKALSLGSKDKAQDKALSLGSKDDQAKGSMFRLYLSLGSKDRARR